MPPEPVKKEQTQTTLEKPESTIEKGLDKVELPPVPKAEKSEQSFQKLQARSHRKRKKSQTQ